MSGFSVTGAFVPKSLETIKSEIEALVLAKIDAALDTSPDQPIGQLIGIMAERESVLWELLQTAYDAFDPTKAEFYLLDALSYLTGTVRKQATKTVVSASCNLNAGTTLSAGAVASVSGHPDLRFLLKADITNGATGATGVTGTFEAENTGPIQCNAGTLTVIPVAITGWNSVTNPTDGELGSDVETDTQLRKRRLAELAGGGSSTLLAIRAQLLKLTGMKQVFGFENTTDVTDGDSLPPHSMEIVVYDGETPLVADADIAKVIWDNKPPGCALYGTTTTTITDALGDTQTVKFSRATVKDVYLTYRIIPSDTNTETLPSDWVTQVKDAAVAKGETLVIGDDVIALKFAAAALSVSGVEDVDYLHLGFTASPVGTSNLTIGRREIAAIDHSRIVVQTS